MDPLEIFAVIVGGAIWLVSLAVTLAAFVGGLSYFWQHIL